MRHTVHALRCAVRDCGRVAETTVTVPGGEVGACLAHDVALERATERGDAGTWLATNVGGPVVLARRSAEVAVSLLVGHADAAHQGVINPACERCRDLTAQAGVLLIQSTNDSTNGADK